MSEPSSPTSAGDDAPLSAYARLRRFIAEQMAMSHIYQPLMLKVLLEEGGSASVRTIASAFLARDQSQLEYYDMIVNRYPRATLKKHGLITWRGKIYSLADGVAALTPDERKDLIALCEDRIHDYLTRRGRAPWSHRLGALDPIPGRTWFEVIERARRRCEACGASAAERALHVDHIVPRSVGGSNDASNLQALCITCNLQKSNRSQTNFSLVEAEYARRAPACPCCQTMVDGPDPLVGVYDRRDDVVVIAPRRHVASYFDLGQAEVNALRRLELEIRAEMSGSIREVRIPTDPSIDHCRVVLVRETGA